MRSRTLSRPLLIAVAAILAAAPAFAQSTTAPPQTPFNLVATYQTIANVIYAAKTSEVAIVRTILETTHDRALQAVEGARSALKAGDTKGAQSAIETAAGLVGQIATEGDSQVAAVRKRMLEGGHHHHAQAEGEGFFDEGYVVVNKVAKAAFLESSKSLGQMARTPSLEALEKEWTKVETTWSSIMK